MADNDKCLPFSTISRPMIAKIFQLNSNKSETIKYQVKIFSICSLWNWAKMHKKLVHYSISGSVVPSDMQKLWAPLATIFVGKKFWKKFWWGFRHIWVTLLKEFLMSWKKWRFEIFWNKQSVHSQWSMAFNNLSVILGT